MRIIQLITQGGCVQTVVPHDIKEEVMQSPKQDNIHGSSVRNVGHGIAEQNWHHQGVSEWFHCRRWECHVGASFGWLGDYRRIDYRHRMRARRDWVLGFGIGYLRPSGVIHLMPIPIINYSCVVEGQLFQA